MNDNEWHAWHPASRSHHEHHAAGERFHKPPVPETTLHEMFIEENRKVFTVALKENIYGRFLRITEEKMARHSCVIVPAEAMEDFLTVVIEMVQTHKKIPSTKPPAPPPG